LLSSSIPNVLAAPSPAGSSQLQIIGKDGKPAGFVPLRHTRDQVDQPMDEVQSVSPVK
jgi:hypothetical protein